MLLEGAMKAQLNIIISGGTGSGKTTLLNTLSSFISNDDRIVTIEDAAELQLQQEHVVRLETRPPNIEGKGAITATDLVRNCSAYAARPDHHRRVPRSGNARHAAGHEHRPRRLAHHLPRQHAARRHRPSRNDDHDGRLRHADPAMRQQIASAVDLIVQANRLQGGPRKVTHITEIIGMEQDTIVMQDIFKYNQEGVDENGRAVGHFEATGIRPTFMPRLESRGVRLPASAFRERIMLRD